MGTAHAHPLTSNSLSSRKRHTLLALFFGISSLLYIAIFAESSGDDVQNVKK